MSSNSSADEMREAFNRWMTEEALCIIGSSDPYPKGLEQQAWALWLTIALDLRSRPPSTIGDTHVLSSLIVAESAVPMLPIPNYNLQVVAKIEDVVNSGPGISYVGLMPARHKVEQQAVVEAVKKAVDHAHQTTFAHGVSAKFDEDRHGAILKVAKVPEMTREEMYQLARFGANVIRPWSHRLFIETGYTKDGLVFEGYRAVGHTLNRIRRIKTAGADYGRWTEVRNGAMLRHCVEQAQSEYKNQCPEFAIFAHAHHTDVEGRAFGRIGASLAENGLDYPVRITRGHSMTIDLNGEYALRRISLERSQAETLYALYPSLFTAPPRIAI